MNKNEHKAPDREPRRGLTPSIPAMSSLSFAARQPVPKGAERGLGAAGSLDIYYFGNTAEVSGFFSPNTIFSIRSTHAWGSLEGSVQFWNLPRVKT